MTIFGFPAWWLAVEIAIWLFVTIVDQADKMIKDGGLWRIAGWIVGVLALIPIFRLLPYIRDVQPAYLLSFLAYQAFCLAAAQFAQRKKST